MALPAQTRALRLALVAVALFGVLLVTHLSLQSANDFAFGCSGVVGAETAADSGCDDVTQSQWATVFGIPQTALGFVFYGLMALLRLLYAVRRDDKLRLAAFALATLGVLYSAYLVFLQATQIGAFCALCMGSAATTLVLFLLHVIEHRRLRGVADAPARTAKPEPTGLAALRPYAPILGLFVVLLGADVVLARAGRDAAAPDGPTPSLSTAAAASGGNAAAPGGPVDLAQCTFDPAIAPIADTSPLTQGPFVGTEGAPVEIIEIFDPNCPHCKDMKALLDPVVEANRARVRFYPVAYALRETSVGQVVALTMAQQQGKYFELIDEMFRRQDQTWGMTRPEIEAAATAAGMNGASVGATLADPMRLQPLMASAQAISEAVARSFATADGGISVPKVAINGRVLASSYASYSPECLQKFIDDAAGAPAPAAPAGQ